MLSIGEVSKLTGISPYTLRYWEKEFNGILEPKRTKGGQRRYSKSCLRIIDEIYFLLKEEMYSI
ncbi:MerR family transcriptional regulator, partial [candidate division KSB1 bacterium]